MTIESAKAAVAVATEALNAANAALDQAASVAGKHASDRDARDRHLRSVAFLGQRPEIGAEPVAPDAPDGERPTPASEAHARETVRRSQEFVGRRAVAETNLDTAKRAAQKKQEDHRAAVAAKTHAVALVAAVRRAPGVIARQQAEALGDMGPVTIEFPEVTEATPNPPAVVVLVDGVPLDGASDGAVIEAGLAFRLAIRRLAKMPEIPVFVDRVNLLNGGAGPWPDEPNVVYLMTTQTEGLSVTAGVP